MTLRLDSFSIAIEYHLNVRRVIIAMQPSVSNTTTKVDVEAMVYLQLGLWLLVRLRDYGIVSV